MNTACIVHDLHQETPYLMEKFDEFVDVSYVREKGELIASFPAALDKGEVDRYERSYVIVALSEDGKKGYLWDVVEAENRENNYRRMRNGMNQSTFADCEFYFVTAPAVPIPNVFGAPATDRLLYAPYFNRH